MKALIKKAAVVLCVMILISSVIGCDMLNGGAKKHVQCIRKRRS